MEKVEILNLIANTTASYDSGFKFIGILSVVLYGISFVGDVFSIGIIFKSRFKLKLIEMLIFLFCQMQTFAYKLVSMLILTGAYSDMYVFGSYMCVWFYPLLLTVSFCFNLTLVYLALYHHSAIKRTGYHVKLFAWTHSVRIFLTFESIVLIGSATAAFSVYHMFTSYVIETARGQCTFNFRSTILLAFSSVIAIIVLVVLMVYLMSILTILSDLKSNRACLTSEQNRYRKSFRVSVKFFSFAVLPMFSCFVRFSFVGLFYLCSNCQRYVYDFIQFLSVLNYIVEPFVLISIHKVLRKQYVKFLKNLFSCKKIR